MEEWKTYKLGDLIKIKYGKDHKSLADGNYPAYGSGGVMRMVERPIYDKPSILIPRKGSLNNIIYTEKPFWTVDTMFWTIIDTKLVLPHYLYYTIKDVDFASLNVGSAVPSLTCPIIEAIEVSIPSIETQKMILNCIEPLDSKIELNNRINHNLEMQAQALYKSWFVDFEPFRGGKFVNSELGLIPIGWDAKPLSSICHIEKKTINPQKYPTCLFTHYSIPAYDNSELPELQKGSDILSNKYIISDYTILFSKLNPRIKRIWNVYQSESNPICSTEFVVYKPMNIDTYPFLYSFITGDVFYNNIMSKVNGATGSHQRFHPEETLDILVPYHIDCYRLYSQLVLPIIQQIDENKRENHYFSSLRDSLLPKLMSGELKINDLTC